MAVADTPTTVPAMPTSSHNPAQARATALEAMQAAPKGECVYDTQAAASAAGAMAAAAAAASVVAAVAVVVVEEVAPTST